MENQSDEFWTQFQCPVCQDLLFKPVVLACGHIACFWCVFEAMDCFRESRCPVCRCNYNHFPSICQLLHSLLLKKYPLAFKLREKEVIEEEEKRGSFSPQFYDYPAVSDLSQEVVVADLLCAGCKQLLCRPVVLNCGHVYCETCIINPSVEVNKCQICQCVHPNGWPKACLVLDHFLEEHFSEEYTARKEAVPKQDTTQAQQHAASSSTIPPGCSSPQLSDQVPKVHMGVGCNSCGMYPIIGVRYKCEDCLEGWGFDMCEECYNSSSKHLGRFYQQHTPEHKFKILQPLSLKNMIWRVNAEDLNDISYVPSVAGDASNSNSEDQGTDSTT